MTERHFSMDDQVAFARLSGDFNPVHVDAIAARRLMFGSPIVHGMHLVLWALDAWSAARPGARPTALRGSFARPVHVGDTAGLEMADRAPGQTRLYLSVGGGRVASLQLDWTEDAAAPGPAPQGRVPQQVEPRLLSAADIEAHPSGRLDLCWPAEAAAALFNGLDRRLDPAWLAVIATASRLVGVECPGLHSVFGEISLQRGAPASGQAASAAAFNDAAPDDASPDAALERAALEGAALEWAVQSWDPRFRHADISLAGGGLSGRIGAFLRPAPRRQPGMADLATDLAPDAFAGQRYLVVGGSRGLGEVAGKLLARGGAEVVLSYARGAADAEAVAVDIRRGGGAAETLRIDVLQEMPAGLGDLGITHLCYFATPFAFAGARGRFSADLHGRFADVYVDGFLRVFDRLKPGLSGVLYPSSVAVDEVPPDMGEYAAAKAAGEIMCRHLAASHRGIRFVTPRLPRLDTDQTQSLSQVENADPVPLLSRLLAEFTAG